MAAFGDTHAIARGVQVITDINPIRSKPVVTVVRLTLAIVDHKGFKSNDAAPYLIIAMWWGVEK